VSPAANPFARPRARGFLGRAGLVVVLAAQAFVLSIGAQGATTTAQAVVVESASDIRIVTANLRSPQTPERFQADAREVIAQHPDLITYNEVYNRQDMFLAPDGYTLWRTPGHYLGNTPVAWKTRKWTDVAHGTRRISYYPTRPPGKHTYLGIRYANWVSLESPDGRRLSVVSVHVAPPFNDENGDRVDLLRPTVRKVSRLVDELKGFGPVLIGGDFNVPYNSARYPRDLLTAARMRPTYDLLGTSFPTGDHHGATIDYVFVRGKGQLEADWHRPVELNSDHDAVVAGLSWTTEAPQSEVTTTVKNQPDGTTAERRAVARELRRRLAQTAAGDTVQLGTRGMNLGVVDRALRDAEARGVRVRVTTRSLQLTAVERRLNQTLDANGSWLRRCQDACRTQWEADEPPSLLLVSGTDRQGKVRIDVSRPLRRTVITRRTSARITNSTTEMDAARAAFARR
jgi:endonuclease/exonuclease/phosphatase (EEP) superfamily protein YafD